MMRIAYRRVPGRSCSDELMSCPEERHGYRRLTEAGSVAVTLLEWLLEAQRTGYRWRQRTWPQSGAAWRICLVPHLFDSPSDRL